MIECGLVLRSIGYRGVPLPGIPFDERRGLIRNEGGRVVDDSGVPAAASTPSAGSSAAPRGVIGTNKKDAADTVARILEDAEAGALRPARRPSRRRRGGRGVADASAPPRHVTWAGWEAIDAHESALGEPPAARASSWSGSAELVEAARVRAQHH